MKDVIKFLFIAGTLLVMTSESLRQYDDIIGSSKKKKDEKEN